MWNKISLRKRITIMSSSILILFIAFLTIVLVVHANNLYANTINAMTKNTVMAKNQSVEQLIQSTRQDFIIQGLVIFLLMIILGSILIWFITKKMIKPVTELTEKIDNIDINNISQSIEVPKSHDDIKKLTEAFNRMMLKINQTLESQKRFVQNAAHELKTPLASILANIEILEMDHDSSIKEYQEVFQVTKENVERMSLLVKDLLMMNSYKQEQMTEFYFSDMDIFSLDLKEAMKKKNITICQKGDTRIKGNQPLFERAFHNIIHNAIRYNVNGGRIDIICKKNNIIISDTGIGIPNDQISKIFEPFYCVDISRSRSLGGSGLGLSIVKQIFEQYDTKIIVESTINKGTTFTIKFKS